MSNKYLALLRGINVGGNNIIKMDALKTAFEEMRFAGVKTYIQSGNVIFSAAENDKAKLTAKIEKQLSKKFGFEARVAVLTFDELRTAAAEIPPEFGQEPKEYRYDMWFLKEPAKPDDVMRCVKIREGVDRVYKGKKVIYASRLNSMAGKSYLTKIIQEPVYQYMTIRGLNTTQKLLELMSRGET
ncbi:MAG: DUF1697 domain-containing protein [Treponema sp.]|jgi:uncharacterized protein (DUF1697 family)|nr:DUF1697 domain-containing protein [Treponema sp.]